MEKTQNKMIVIYTTFPDSEVAHKISRKLVEGGLAGCVNIFNGMTSLYKWEGHVQEEDEVGVFIKSTENKLQQLVDRIKTLHPYEAPVIFTLNPENVDPVYKKWLDSNLN